MRHFPVIFKHKCILKISQPVQKKWKLARKNRWPQIWKWVCGPGNTTVKATTLYVHGKLLLNGPGGAGPAGPTTWLPHAIQLVRNLPLRRGVPFCSSSTEKTTSAPLTTGAFKVTSTRCRYNSIKIYDFELSGASTKFLDFQTSNLRSRLYTVFENHRKSLIQHCERSEL